MTASSSLESYARGWRERARAGAAREAEWRRGVRARLTPLVEFLVREYGATRIVLFGSLVRAEARPGSDVDLLVYGLNPAKVLEAAAAADRLMVDVSVDLVPVEIARTEVRARAEQEGEVLLG